MSQASPFPTSLILKTTNHLRRQYFYHHFTMRKIRLENELTCPSSQKFSLLKSQFVTLGWIWSSMTVPCVTPTSKHRLDLEFHDSFHCVTPTSKHRMDLEFHDSFLV